MPKRGRCDWGGVRGALFATVLLLLSLNIGNTEAANPDTRNAAEEGTATVLIKDISLQEFAETKYFFQEVVSRYASMHCQKHSDNCNTDAKNISPSDVIVTSEKTKEPSDVDVELHIQESEDPNMAALTSTQLADVFYDFDEQIEKSYGYKVEVLEPTRSWESWRIATVVIISLIIVILVIFAIWLAYDSNKKYQAMALAKQVLHVKRLSAYESLHLENEDAAKRLAYESLKEDGSNVSDGPPSHRTTLTDVPYDNAIDNSNTTTFRTAGAAAAAAAVYDNPVAQDAINGSTSGAKAEEEEDYFELTSL